ncbi:EAL domain-containing protein [Amaricoccus tamworthensis]|uniref:EAL domain-containing protein n=1 Tax=Amaricoccus tamworthensis TaxID=57002 RepID=UPI003C7CE524
MKTVPAIDAFRLMNDPAGNGRQELMGRVEANARVRFTVAQALSQGRLGFHYQPVVRSDNPGFAAFHEMLARIRMPNGQILPAGAFLPTIEATELGRAVDRAALEHSLSVLANNPGLRLSVNLSPLSMGDEQWLSILTAAHRGGTGVCGRLILEITETAAISEADQTIEFMNFVRSMGPAFALDDFGAGAAGFRHFSRFRFDMVKIDGSFVQGVHRSPDSQVLIGCLLKLAKHFEMLCIAERVECVQDAEWLTANGVDCMQGYLFGRPSAAAESPHNPDNRRRAAG